MTNNKLIISPSPHVYRGDSVEKNMYGVSFKETNALLKDKTGIVTTSQATK
jgi:hypothetical protein